MVLASKAPPGRSGTVTRMSPCATWKTGLCAALVLGAPTDIETTDTHKNVPALFPTPDPLDMRPIPARAPGATALVLVRSVFGAGGSYGYNLRHAWGQLGNTYVGYGWSAFMDLDAGPDTLDFAGPGVIPFGRVTSIRQYFPLRSGNQLVLAAE